MHGKASAMFVRISPSKMRQVANVVRGMGINEALDTLKHMNKKAADTIYKVVYSALSNATHLASEEDPIDADKLFVETIYADEGPTMKRIRARAKGRASRILKRSSHVSVTVAEN